MLRRFLRSADFVSGCGISAFVAAYVFPGLFLIVPHASRSSAVSGAFYPAVMALVAVLGACSVSALWLTKAVDPGYLTPLVGPLDADTAAAIAQQPDSYSLPRRRRKAGDEAAVAGRDGEEWEEFCYSCRIWRPPRCGHCGFCGACVQRFDHHCGVIGACVAGGNARFFTAMLAALAAGCALLLVADVVWLLDVPFYRSASYHHWQPYVALFFLLWLLYTVALAAFAGFHCLLILSDRTTRELCGRQRRSLERTEAEREGACSAARRAVRGCRLVCAAPLRCLRLDEWPEMRRSAAAFCPATAAHTGGGGGGGRTAA